MSDAIAASLQDALGSAYTIERELGGGGMSRVFLARDEALGRHVAVKVLAPELARSLIAERFASEIQRAAQLQEPHIVPVYATGTTRDALPYYVMPFIRGVSLRARLAEGRLPAADAVRLLRDVAQALAYAHAHGVVHGDLEPENVLLASGTAMVTDFGVANAVSAARTNDAGARAPSDITLTEIGPSPGSPAYMAPEQVAGVTVDARADIYAWGVIAYETLAGRHPFAERASAQQLMAAHIAEPPKPLGTVARGVPSRLAALVMRCLAKRPEERPASAGEIVDTLGDAALFTEPDERRTPRRSPAFRVLLAAASVFVVVLAVWLARRWASLKETARETGPAAVMTTVAVLPFANASGNAQDEYLSDGMTDELAHALARLPAMRVAGRTSSYTFEGKAVRVQDVGKALGVAGVIEGTVRRAGDRLRVSAQLASAADGLVVWTGTFDAAAGDVFQVQDSVTRAIVSALAPALAGNVAPTLAGRIRGTANANAYDFFLRGDYSSKKRGAENLTRAVAYFDSAVARDTSFARAYAARALAHAALPGYSPSASSDSAYALTHADAARALALDPRSAPAHLALGSALYHAARFAEADSQYAAAVALDPDEPQGHARRGDVLLALGHPDEAIAEARRATELDPLSADFAVDLSSLLTLTRRYPEALAAAHRAVALDTTSVAARRQLARVLAYAGQPDSAVALRRATRGDEPDALLVYALAAAGRRRDAVAVRDTLARRVRAARAARGARGDSLRAQVEVTVADVALGDARPFLAMLADSLGTRAIVRWPDVWCDPVLDPARSDPRFAAAMQRLGVHMCAASAAAPTTH